MTSRIPLNLKHDYNTTTNSCSCHHTAWLVYRDWTKPLNYSSVCPRPRQTRQLDTVPFRPQYGNMLASHIMLAMTATALLGLCVVRPTHCAGHCFSNSSWNFLHDSALSWFTSRHFHSSSRAPQHVRLSSLVGADISVALSEASKRQLQEMEKNKVSA